MKARKTGGRVAWWQHLPLNFPKYGGFSGRPKNFGLADELMRQRKARSSPKACLKGLCVHAGLARETPSASSTFQHYRQAGAVQGRHGVALGKINSNLSRPKDSAARLTRTVTMSGLA
jgi:hypothetical protein